MTLNRPKAVNVILTQATLSAAWHRCCARQCAGGERDALYQGLRSEGVARQKVFVAVFVQSGADPRALEQEPLDVSWDSSVPLPSLQAAIEASDLVVTATVAKSEYQFDQDGSLYSYATVNVSKALKGAAPREVRIRQSGGPNFNGSEDHPYLMVVDGDAPLFAGDKAVLLLKAVDGGLYEALPVVGQYGSTAVR